MNERIEELVKQATKTERHYAGISGYDVSEFDKEKFAELILKDCIALLEEHRARYADPGTYESEQYYIRMDAKEDAMEDVISDLRYRFGLKNSS